MVILRPNQKWNGSLVEASPLPVPLLDGIERALSRQVEHEQNSDGIIADEWEHIYELALSAKIPDGEGDLGIPNGNRLFHEIDT